jgi:hypothetical protein
LIWVFNTVAKKQKNIINISNFKRVIEGR